MKKFIEKVKESGWFVWLLILGIPFIIGLLGFNEIVYIGFIAILTLILIIGGFLEEEKTFGSFILSIISIPFIGFAIGALLMIPAGIGQIIGGTFQSEALIKGNISYETHEKIYHTPGCKHYDDTVINTSDGEKWFKTEEEAKKAGWRKCRTDDRYY